MKFDIEKRFCTIKAGELSTLKAGGLLSKVYYPSTIEELHQLSKYINDNNKEYIIIGSLSNTLVLDGGYDGIIISGKNIKGIDIEKNIIRAGCGESLLKLINTASKQKLSGIEKLFGIPGSVGGAVCMNCGCFGQEISDTISRVYLFDIDSQKITEKTKKELGFGYRSSTINTGDKVVIGACFKLKERCSYDIKNTIRSVIELRRNTQPRQPSLGSVFKRVDNTSAAIFIEGAKLKGHSINGMQVSTKHANFIVNNGNGNADDYLSLVEEIEERVHQCYGIELEREVRIIGKRAERTGHS